MLSKMPEKSEGFRPRIAWPPFSLDLSSIILETSVDRLSISDQPHES
jgi:hypothetical protein